MEKAAPEILWRPLWSRPIRLEDPAVFWGRQQIDTFQSSSDIECIAQEAAEQFGLTPEEIIERVNEQVRVHARSLFCYWAVRELGSSSTEPSTILRLTQPVVSISVNKKDVVQKN